MNKSKNKLTNQNDSMSEPIAALYNQKGSTGFYKMS